MNEIMGGGFLFGLSCVLLERDVKSYQERKRFAYDKVNILWQGDASVATLTDPRADYRFSSGAARLVNKACTHCLLYGSQKGRRIIDDHMVKLVIQGG